MIKGFREFILRGNVVDLAIAVVIGTAFTALVKAFVADILTPIVGAIIGQPNFATLTFTINKSHFLYGDLINAAITFLAVAAAVYFFVVAPLNAVAARRARGKPTPPEELPADIALLTEIRDLLAKQDGTAPAAEEGTPA
jgi:large conductance mechanosensitive channel